MTDAEDIIARSKVRAEVALRAYLDSLVPPKQFDMESPLAMREHVSDLLTDLMHLWHGVGDELTDPLDGDDWLWSFAESAQTNWAEEQADALPGGAQ